MRMSPTISSEELEKGRREVRTLCDIESAIHQGSKEARIRYPDLSSEEGGQLEGERGGVGEQGGRQTEQRHRSRHRRALEADLHGGLRPTEIKESRRDASGRDG